MAYPLSPTTFVIMGTKGDILLQKKRRRVPSPVRYISADYVALSTSVQI